MSQDEAKHFPDWVKVSYNGKVKRIAQPEKTLEGLLTQSVKHFGSECPPDQNFIYKLLWDDVSLWESACLEQSRVGCNLNKSVHATEISDDIEYQNIMLMYAVHQNQSNYRIPRFLLLQAQQNLKIKSVGVESNNNKAQSMLKSLFGGINEVLGVSSTSFIQYEEVKETSVDQFDAGQLGVSVEYSVEIQQPNINLKQPNKSDQLIASNEEEQKDEVVHDIDDILKELENEKQSSLIQLPSEIESSPRNQAAEFQQPQILTNQSDLLGEESDQSSEKSDQQQEAIEGIRSIVRKILNREASAPVLFATQLHRRGVSLDKFLENSVSSHFSVPRAHQVLQLQQQNLLEADDSDEAIQEAQVEKSEIKIALAPVQSREEKKEESIKLIESQSIQQQQLPMEQQLLTSQILRVKDYVEEEKLEEVMNVYLRAEMTQPVVQPQKPMKQFFTNMMASITFAVTGEDQNLPSVKLTQNQESEVYCEFNHDVTQSQFIEVTWRLRNDSSIDWPAQLQLVPVISSPNIRTFFESRICPLRANSEGRLKLKCELPADFNYQHLIVFFKMRTKQKQYFGPSLILLVKLVQKSLNLQQDDRSAFEEQNNDDYAQLNILRRSQRCESFSDDQLISMASILLDEGFGSFERCSMVVRALRGDMEKARTILSKLIICENQIQ